MKPIAVFQHTEVGAPGAVVTILQSLGRTVQLIRIVDGEPVPLDPSAFAGLVFMGGYMGVHDDFPWIAQELDLIRNAAANNVPVAGHCLGSQLVAQALGGSVARHSIPEIGWQPIQAATNAIALDWWGEHAGQDIQTFQWHADSFQPPQAAVRIAQSQHCENQAFVLDDRHLMLQSHLEMTPQLVKMAMARNGQQLINQHAAGNPAVSDPIDLLQNLDARTSHMHSVLTCLYRRWIEVCN